MGLGIQFKKSKKKKKKKEEKEKEKKRQMGLPISDQKCWYQVATLPNREVFFKTASWVLDKTSNTVTKTDSKKRELSERYIVNTGV